MLNFKSGQPVYRRQIDINTSIESDTESNVVSELSEEGAVLASDFGFAEAGVEVRSIAEPEYWISNAVTGFAPSTIDYLDEIAESDFPHLHTVAYAVFN